MNVDELFNDETVADTQEQEIVQEVEQEETQEEQGVKTDVVPPATEQQDSRFVPITALLDERDKRQALERQIAELTKTQQPVQADDDDAFYENPSLFVKSQVQNLKQEMAQQAHMMRVELSESVLFESKPDAKEKIQVFMDEARNNPALVYGMNAAKNPALYAYKEAEKILAVRQVQHDPVAYEKALRAKIMAEIEGKQPLKVPNTLSSTPNLAGGVVQEDTDDFNSLFKR